MLYYVHKFDSTLVYFFVLIFSVILMSDKVYGQHKKENHFLLQLLEV